MANVDQQQLVADLRTQREHLVSYLKTLPEAAWDKESLCEGWRVRDVVSHLVGNARDLATQNLEGVGTVSYNQRQVDERTTKTIDELFAEWDEQGPAYEAAIAALPIQMWEADYPAWGTVGQALERMLEDIWVHTQDIRIALGDAIEDGPGIGAVVHVTAFEIPVRTKEKGVKVGSVDINVGGHQESVATGDGPALKITGDPATFALVATGRISLDDALSDGKLSVDPAPPAGFANVLNIYAG
ncbi:MAG: maleylpyruvate isomerase family mycothiol-dependent enzyme [Actinomycetota bacterium]